MFYVKRSKSVVVPAHLAISDDDEEEDDFVPLNQNQDFPCKSDPLPRGN